MFLLTISQDLQTARKKNGKTKTATEKNLKFSVAVSYTTLSIRIIPTSEFQINYALCITNYSKLPNLINLP